MLNFWFSLNTFRLSDGCAMCIDNTSRLSSLFIIIHRARYDYAWKWLICKLGFLSSHRIVMYVQGFKSVKKVLQSVDSWTWTVIYMGDRL